MRSSWVTVEALVSGHPRDAKKVSVTGVGRLREWFSQATTRGVRELMYASGVSKCNRTWMMTKETLKYGTL